MFVLIPTSWMFFSILDLGDLQTYLLNMFSFTVENSLLSLSDFWLFCKPYLPLLAGCLVCITHLPDWFYHKYRKKPLGIVVILGIFWLSVYYLANSINNPFLYFRF